MSGSLKVVCAAGSTRYASTAAFGTLNAQAAFTFSGWFEIASLGADFTNCDLFGAVTSYPVTVGIANNARMQYFAESSGGAKSISYQPLIDNKGHFIVISYDATGTVGAGTATTVYVDGAPAKTIDSIGTTAAVDQVLNVGFNAAGAAVTLYLKDVAIWGGYAATQADVIALRDGVRTPATLGTPATNWWSLQGMPGAVTAGMDGLIDTLGGINLGTLFGTGTLTYDAHEIVTSHSALMMPPYCDITGNIIFIPLYADPLSTTGGPASPISINVPPVFKLNGVTMDGLSGRPDPPTLLVLKPLFYVIAYQMPSGTSVAVGDVLTMSAPMGWSSTNVGLVGGTSAAGTGSAPLVVINYAGQDTEFPNLAKTLKVGYNTPTGGNSPNDVGQPRANYASRLWEGNPLVSGGWTGGTVLTYDPVTQLPATLSGQARGLVDFGVNNGLDSDPNGTPGILGLWTLTYGDDSIGVTSDAPNQVLEFEFSASWNVERTVVSPGMWNGSYWTGIRKTYLTTYSGSGAYGSGLAVLIDSTNGNVGFPSKGNGQVELGIFPPSPANRSVSSPDNFDPMGIDPEYLLKHQGAYCLRWMVSAAGYTTFGDSSMLTVADLAQRQVNDFLWTNQTTNNGTGTINVTKIEPIGATFNAIIDYQGGTQTMSAANWALASLALRVPMLVTVDPLGPPHGMRTNDTFSIAGTTAAPAPAVKQDSLTLVAPGITVTTSPVTFAVSETPPISIGDVILVGSEQFTVMGISGASITCTRPTAGTSAAIHATGTPVYTRFLTAVILTTSGPTTISLSTTVGLTANIILQVDSEQMIVTAPITSTTAVVTRGVNGTTGATHASGSIVYPCVELQATTTPAFVIDDHRFVLAPNCTYLPSSGSPLMTNPTIKATVNYTSPNCPVFTINKPPNNGSVPYEFAAKFTDTIAVAKGSKTILWINVALLVTDALVTEIIANRVIPFIGPLTDVILELSNEIWIGGTPQSIAATVLWPTAPNPEGVPYTNIQEFVASRQNHVTGIAKLAFTAAGLNPNRVYNFQPGHRQIGFGQPGQNATVAYCQAHGIPIDYLSMDGYIDIPADVWDVFWDLMPTADGGSAAWDRPTSRRVMMSYFRTWCWFSAYFGSAVAGSGQVMSWYKAGKSVVNNGSDSGPGAGTFNTGLGLICYYESATEFLTDPSDFINPRAMMRDLIYDPNWYTTETAYWAAKQGAGAMYAALMPFDSAPDLPSFIPDFSCLYSIVYTYGGEGEAWLTYNWQGQQPGLGLANVYSVPDATPWSDATPVAQDRLNQSVRARVALDWIGGTTPTPTPTPTPTSSVSVIDPNFGMTPMYSVANKTERNLIPGTMRITGMVCYVMEDRLVYRLLQPPWSMRDDDWVSFPS